MGDMMSDVVVPNDCPYSVKSVKTFRGMEGTGFNATLHREGKKVALVIDEGNGGPMIFEWADGGRHNPNAPEARMLDRYVAKLEPLTWTQGDASSAVNVDADLFVAALVEAATVAKRNGFMRRKMRNATLFQVGAEVGGDTARTVAQSYSPKLGVAIRKKYAGQKVRILNEEVV